MLYPPERKALGRGKLKPRGRDTVFVGYDQSTCAYVLKCLRTGELLRRAPGDCTPFPGLFHTWKQQTIDPPPPIAERTLVRFDPPAAIAAEDRAKLRAAEAHGATGKKTGKQVRFTLPEKRATRAAACLKTVLAACPACCA